MSKFSKQFRKLFLLTCVGMLTCSNSGCHLIDGFLAVQYAYSLFWEVTPLIPVGPYWSQYVEDTYHKEERYERAHILDPIEGEHAPLFCLDPPSPDEVMHALPDDTVKGIPFLSETSRSNVRIVVEPIVDRVGECRFYPMAGPARMHHCHYKCTVYFDKTIRSDWPVPFSHTDQTQEVVYVDHDHLIRCAGEPTPQ